MTATSGAFVSRRMYEVFRRDDWGNPERLPQETTARTVQPHEKPAVRREPRGNRGGPRVEVFTLEVGVSPCDDRKTPGIEPKARR